MGLTNFPNGITSFGIPIVSGGFGAFGDVYFVDPRNGNDNNLGTSPDASFKTLSKAYATATSNNNDVIYIDGDSTVTETAMITWSKNRIHVVGCNGVASPAGYGCGAKVSLGVTTDAADTATIRCTGVRNTFTGIKFMNSNTLATCLHGYEEAGEYNRYYNCEFYKSSLLTTDLTAEVLMNGDSSQFFGCTFGDMVNSRGASGKERPNVKFDRETVTGKVCRDAIFEDCTFLQKAAHVDACFMYGKNATDIERRLVIKNCIFMNCILATATVADAVNFGAAQTSGEVLMINPASTNCTAIAGASLNIYVQNAPDGTTSGIAEEIAA